MSSQSPDHVSRVNVSLSASVGGQIKKVCDRFVEDWRGERKPRIEDCLSQISGPDRRVLLLELLRCELAIRRQSGGNPTIDRYLARFPQETELVSEAFESAASRSDVQSTWSPARSFEEQTDDERVGSEVLPRTITFNLDPDDSLSDGTVDHIPGTPDTRTRRYRKVSQLGEGSFGTVWIAEDRELRRLVALKEPRSDRWRTAADSEAYLAEARVLASLDHPHIVPVYDCGRTRDGSCFVVSKLIDGTDLAAYAKQTPLTFDQTAHIVANVAEALQHTHNRGLVHRDIKPANILMGPQGQPYVADFGLALREEDVGQRQGLAGTPAYMSPEQARGEGHLIDGRSDIFSLGVVLYELLGGARPFTGSNWNELRVQITSMDARPLRQQNKAIPKELDRICLKALSRRAADRYSCAADLADELRRWADTPEASMRTATTTIVPKGLRSFDSSDSDFFLDLLPGARDRNGLPETLRFWKTRIEETDPDRTFRVGLVYGPSGCGKSSLMKAGLLPRLADHVIHIFLEATQDQTEQQLQRALQRACPDLPRNRSLTESLSAIRRGNGIPAGRKVVLVLDQFEQWLYAHGTQQNTELEEALRQCDGQRIQSVLLVRDDFWMPVSEFLRALEVPLLEGINASAVSLFDPLHARKVLGEFGKAYGRLPEHLSKLSGPQDAFLNQSVSGLAQDGKVICVRLALFADMLKGREWTPEVLQQVGGTAGVGTTFLEETFSSRTAPPQHRRHQEAARAVLQALLPETGTDIKGHMRSHAELLTASGYQDRPTDFNDLLRILDGELRLITPTDPEGTPIGEPDASASGSHPFERDNSDSVENNPPAHAGGSPSSDSPRYYQLTHDYLVPSLRDWLTRKQRETKKGRAELKLAERAAAWGVNQESKQLPTLVEWFEIRRLTEAAKWKANEKAVMQQATRHHMQRIALTTAAMVLLASGGWCAWRESTRRQEATRIAGLVDTLTNAEPSQIPRIVKQLNANPQVAHVAGEYLAPRLATEAKTPDEQRARLHARLASVDRDPSLVEPLVEELLTGKVNYVLPIRQLLKPSAAKLSESLQSVLKDAQADPPRRFRAALALADYVPPSDEAIWSESHRTFMARELVSSNPEYQPILREALRPIQDKLLSDLERIFGDPAASEAQRLSAANAMADYAANDIGRLTQLLTLATPEQHAVLYPLVSAVPSPETIAQLSEVAAAPPPEDLGSVPRIAYGQRRANAAVTMLRLGEKEKVLPVFDWTDDPEAMTQFIVRCKPRGITIDTLLDLLEIPTRSVSEGSNHARYALLLAIGEYAPSDIPAARRESLIQQLAHWYANDPSSGVHGASGWLLRHLGETEIADRVDQTPVPYSPDREWFTLAITVKPTPPPQPKPEKQDESEASQTKAEESNTEKSDSPNPGTEPQQSELPPEPLPPKTFYYTFIVHPIGEYPISSVEDEVGRDKATEVRQKVTLTRSFALLDREITFAELFAFSPKVFSEIMDKFDVAPSDAGYGVHWYESVAFCRWLGQEMGLAETDQCYADPEKLDMDEYPRDPVETSFPRNWPLDLSKRGFRLPTESEWEVMARSGSRTAYGYGSDVALLDRFGWFTENCGKKVHPGREKRPSVRGMYDLHGNVYEWTHDWKGDLEGDLGEIRQTDPLGPETGLNRVHRGGSWAREAVRCRSANRDWGSPTRRSSDYGFRLAVVPSSPANPDK